MQEALSTGAGTTGGTAQVDSDLTTPPFFPAVSPANANTPHVQGALVQTGEERRVVQMGDGLSSEQLMPGDEVFLNHERNFVVAESPTANFLTGEVATYNRSTEDGRLVLQHRDEEVVVSGQSCSAQCGPEGG